MMKTTKTSDCYTVNPGSTMLINSKMFHDCEQNTCENMKLLKYNDDLIQFEEEEEDDNENCTSTDQADDNDEDEDDDDDDDDDDEDDEERDLTNLTWLTELRNQTMSFVNMAFDEDTKKDNEFAAVAVEQIYIQQPSHRCQVTKNQEFLKSNANILGKTNQKIILQSPDELRAAKILVQSKRPSPAERYEMFLNKIKRDLEIYEESAINYQFDIVEKPPFNYSHIIGMAMLENGRRVTLQQICSWIERKFAYFRVRKKWNNSIRHNLSLHPCFRKIGRNKEDKGKGGYWELGVDLKKCERKRIRNRKSTVQSGKMQKKHLQTHFIKTAKRRQQNFTIMKKSNFKHHNGSFRNFAGEEEYEELLLDEMDVEHSIDVISTNTNNNNNNDNNNSNNNSISENNNNSDSNNSNIKAITCFTHSESQTVMQQIHSTTKRNSESPAKDEKKIMLRNLANDNDNGNDHDHAHLQKKTATKLKSFNKSCALSNGDFRHGNKPFSARQMSQRDQQYKLGTIIISAANVGADIPNTQTITQRTINSFLESNSTKRLLTARQESTANTYYSQNENVPQQNNNSIIPSYISSVSNGFSSCTPESKSTQSHNSFTSSRPSNSITTDFSAFPTTQPIQQKPNVIVEHLIQQPSLSYSTTEIRSEYMPTSMPKSLNSSTTTMCSIGSQNGDYPNGFVSQDFRPYIDGIDEAFQYLRSIDSTRNEEILDNLLDISVSDY